MPQIHKLEPVDLREAWPNEALDFTPWLAEHLELLGAELNLDLELVQKEARFPDGGRVDVLAREVRTGTMVVIENQLVSSDDSHLMHLLGYATNADARILVWVARDFVDNHRRILSWLNTSDTIDVYAVKVSAYRVGDFLAADFRTVVEPTQSRPGIPSPALETMNTHYAQFYGPLVAQLRRSELQPVGRGGWRGRWRSFQTGHSHAIYAAGLDQGKAQVFLYVNGPDHRRVYHALSQYRVEIDSKLGGSAAWGQEEGFSCLTLETEAALPVPEDDQETVRQWMADNLIRLRAALQPYLEQAMDVPDAGQDDAEDAE